MAPPTACNSSPTGLREDMRRAPEGLVATLPWGVAQQRAQRPQPGLIKLTLDATQSGRRYQMIRLGSTDGPCHAGALLVDALLAWRVLAVGGLLRFECPGGVERVDSNRRPIIDGLLDYLMATVVPVYEDESMPFLDDEGSPLCEDDISSAHVTLRNHPRADAPLFSIDFTTDLHAYASDLCISSPDSFRFGASPYDLCVSMLVALAEDKLKQLEAAEDSFTAAAEPMALDLSGVEHLNVTHNFFAAKDMVAAFLVPWFSLLGWYENSTAEVHILEIGSFQGLSTSWLLRHVLQHPRSSITCLDSWEGGAELTTGVMADSELRFDQNVGSFGAAQAAKVKKVRGESFHSLVHLVANAGLTYDLIHVDGAHVAPRVFEDAVLSYHLLKPTGWMLFDDIGWQYETPFMRDPTTPKLAVEVFERAFWDMGRKSKARSYKAVHQRHLPGVLDYTPFTAKPL